VLLPTELRPQLRRWDLNPRSRAHEAREDGRSSTALGLAGRSRTCDLRCPKPAGWPSSPTARRKNPRRDSNPQLPDRESGVIPFRPRGQKGSGGRNRTCALAGNNRASYRLDHAGTRRLYFRDTPCPVRPRASPWGFTFFALRRKTETAGLEPARRRTALRRSKALPYRSAMSPERKERESNPQGPKTHPFSRRDTAPVAVLPEWPPQASNLQPPG
jgi:hypothetical protein